MAPMYFFCLILISVLLFSFNQKTCWSWHHTYTTWNMIFNSIMHCMWIIIEKTLACGRVNLRGFIHLWWSSILTLFLVTLCVTFAICSLLFPFTLFERNDKFPDCANFVYACVCVWYYLLIWFSLEAWNVTIIKFSIRIAFKSKCANLLICRDSLICLPW